MQELNPTLEEIRSRDIILTRIVEFVATGRVIKLPAFDRSKPTASRFALQSVPLEGGDFSGRVGDYLYQFEGEEDLLHLMVTLVDGCKLAVEEAQIVANFTLVGVSPALIWLKPGTYSHHFYLGHDELVAALQGAVK